MGSGPDRMRSAGLLGIGALASGFLSVTALAADPRIAPVDPFAVPPEQSTASGLYVSAADALRALTGHPDILLVDVRMRSEARRRGAVGMPAQIVPFLIAGPDGGPVRNPHFVAGIRRAMAVRGLRPGATVVLVCDKAIQSAQAADDLALHAVPNVYSLIGGIEALRKARIAATRSAP